MRRSSCCRGGSTCRVLSVGYRDPPHSPSQTRAIMAFQQFFIKNTFIFVPTQSDEDSRDGVEARRSKSAPPKMRSLQTGEDGAKKIGHIIAEDIELVGQVVEGSSEADEQGDEEVSEVEDITGPSLMPSHKAAEPQIRPSVLRRQQERMIDQFLDGEISKVRAEKWGALSRRLVEFCTQKYSLSALRIDLLVPRRRLVINKLCLMHIASFTGLTAGMMNAMKRNGMLREKGATMEIWVATRDARNRDVRVLFSAAIRFQKAFEDRQILVQYRGVLSNWTAHGIPI